MLRFVVCATLLLWRTAAATLVVDTPTYSRAVQLWEAGEAGAASAPSRRFLSAT